MPRALTRSSKQKKATRSRTGGQTQRRLQRRLDRSPQRKKAKEEPTVVQAGARLYPAPPLPQQHQIKPGLESALDPAPMYDAPYYIGSKKLNGKIALITGGDSGIGRAVAVLFAREGADVAIAYLSAQEQKDAEVTQAAVEMEERRCLLLRGTSRPCDSVSAVHRVVTEFGGLNVLVNNAISVAVHPTCPVQLCAAMPPGSASASSRIPRANHP